jgi:RNA-directed DNA polymerase
VNGQSIAKFGACAETCLAELEQGIKEGSYHPLPVKRVEIPKADGKKRPLGIPSVKDWVVHERLRTRQEPKRSQDLA